MAYTSVPDSFSLGRIASSLSARAATRKQLDALTEAIKVLQAVRNGTPAGEYGLTTDNLKAVLTDPNITAPLPPGDFQLAEPAEWEKRADLIHAVSRGDTFRPTQAELDQWDQERIDELNLP